MPSDCPDLLSWFDLVYQRFTWAFLHTSWRKLMQNQLRSKWSYKRKHHNFLKAFHPKCNKKVLIILNASVLKWCIAGSEPQLLYKSNNFRFGSRMRQDLSQACYWSLKTFLVGSCCRYGLHGRGTLSIAHFDTSWVKAWSFVYTTILCIFVLSLDYSLYILRWVMNFRFSVQWRIE